MDHRSTHGKPGRLPRTRRPGAPSRPRPPGLPGRRLPAPLPHPTHLKLMTRTSIVDHHSTLGKSGRLPRTRRPSLSGPPCCPRGSPGRPLSTERTRRTPGPDYLDLCRQQQGRGQERDGDRVNLGMSEALRSREFRGLTRSGKARRPMGSDVKTRNDGFLCRGSCRHECGQPEPGDTARGRVRPREGYKVEKSSPPCLRHTSDDAADE